MPAYVTGHIANAHLPSAQPKDKPPTGHRCSNCYGPYGLSAIPCPNNTRPRVLAFLATREQIRDERES